MHVIDSGGLYGAETMLLDLIDEQVKLGLDPIVASIGEKHIFEKPLEAEANRRSIKIKKFRMIPGPNVLGAINILKYAKHQKINVLHSHGFKGNILLGFIPQKIRKIPMLTTLHGYTNIGEFSKMKIYEWFDLFSHRFMAANILVNKGMLSNLKLKKQKHLNFHVINNGIPVSFISNNLSGLSNTLVTKKIVDFSRNRFAVGTIGRLSSEKGYPDLIKAVLLLIQKGIDACLIIIGEGKKFQELKNLINKYKMADRVLFTGYCKNAKKYIPLFNVYAISSYTEGLPITLLEAMAAKIPVVSTNVGGIPEVLDNGRAGIIVPAGKPAAMAEAFYKIYKNRDFANKIKEIAFERLKKNYTSKSMALRYLEVYKKICAS